ncbi:MAG: aldehyde dehydrogenase family protein [Bacteroidia bacterium]|nr:aldehyde dehydrogenase family protein [Bacteroidia bacterium]
MTTIAPALQTDVKKIKGIFNSQTANQFEVGNTTAKQRLAKLDKLYDAVLKYKQEIREALYADFKKPEAEVDLTEIYIVTSEIKHARRHLKQWMSREKVETPMSMLGSSSWIHYEPKGVVLIISPWNFPINLTFGPLISAIAAGNCVMIKPSEHTPHSSAVMQKIIDEIYDEQEVALIQGGVETSTELLKLPFNHIFFTGAPSIGKVVMAAASKHLSSVTLELGGKSPTIVDETANLGAVATRMAWGKFANNGQVCIAPDYVLVHESKKDALIDAVKEKIEAFYGTDVSKSKDYCRMVNGRHHARVQSMIDDAVANGGKVVMGGESNASEDYIAPTMITDVSLDSKIMTEEIFGPVLPIVTYAKLDEAIDLINSKEKPLALYIYSKSKKNINKIMKHTRAGGTCINNSDVHFFNTNLPFGGSNNSGIGKSHGRYGFEAFSNARSVLQQNIPGALEMLMPPYTDFKQKLIDLTIKWF